MHWLVVGGGTAGCVVASRLSEDRSNHVTVVEAGPHRASSDSASYLDDLAVPGATWDGLTVTDGGGPARPYPQGRGLGGSSAVNGGVLSGGDPAVLGGATVADDELGPIDRALLESSPDAVPVVLARRGAQLVSTADVYLSPVLDRGNLDVLADAVVVRVASKGDRAVGVVLGDGAFVAADRVVCAAGAIFTPALLLRSGITTPGIGEGLADHPGRVIELELRDPVDPRGLVTGAVLRRDPIEVVTMNHLGPGALGRGALLVGLLRSRRRGTVRLRSDDPRDLPVADFGAVDGDRLDRLEGGVALALDLLTGSAFRDVVADVTVGDGLGGYAHAACSCSTAVDASGAVIGYEDLFICDASVLPEIPPSGTYLPVVALAERLSRIWAASASESPL